MSPYRHILSLYYRNLAFRSLTVLFVLMAGLSRMSLVLGHYDWADEFFSMFIVFAVWLAFVAGVLIKRQFASHRASLIPRYRRPHVTVLYGLYSLCLIVFALWLTGLHPVIILQKTTLVVIFLLSTLMTTLVVLIGYLSIPMVLFLSYFMVLLFSWQTFNTVMTVTEHPQYNLLVFLLIAGLIGIFTRRLLTLKPYHFEYTYMMSWPTRDFVRNQILTSQPYYGFIRIVKNRLGIKARGLTIPSYPREAGLWIRMQHWHIIERAELRPFWILLLLLTPVYILSLPGLTALHGFFRSPSRNFLLYAIAPVLVVLVLNRRNMTTWQYDIFKPVWKSRFIQERGLALISGLILSWLLIVMYLAVLPNWTLETGLLTQLRFWAFMLLSGSFAALTLGWTVFLSAVAQRPRTVIAHGAVLCLFSEFFFLAGWNLPPIWSLVSSIICFIGASAFFKVGYCQWCQKEL